MSPRYLLPALVALALALCAAPAQATTLLPVGTFQEPIYVTSDPSDANRLFVVERTGKIQLLSGGVTTLFADLGSKVECGTSCKGERGLLSIALAPDFDISGRLYVDYANDKDGSIHVAELRAVGSSAAISTLRDLLVIEHPVDNNHNGGQLQFGPEGLLYVSTGDGGGAGDVHHNAQDLTKPLGKILRIDPNPSGLLPYTVPVGNPFAGTAGDYAPIWSYGLRNPFRFSFDKLTGDMLIGDVGEAKSEEVDFAAAPGLGAGADYGWNCREGLIEGPATDPQCATPPTAGFVNPVYVYPHADPGGGAAFGCAIIGGYVVRDQSLGGLYGRYLYADHCGGGLRSLELSNPFASDRSEGLAVDELDSFGEDSCGRLYVISGAGVVSRLVGSTAAVCEAATPLANSIVGIRAQSRKVRRGGRAVITVFVSPCKGRLGEPVKLLRNGRAFATRHLDRACTARFRPKIARPARFRATAGEDATYVAAASRRLKIRILHRNPAHGHKTH
ncbi:MAG: PQQ-dependent sugar dehydrogenase [Solirubrobacterales bacterium]|nr:PQQ-dependent sugar dehydrogenase [Solirubrobacterales bacterium]